MKWLPLALLLIGCKPVEKTYIVTCRFPRETTVDTIVTKEDLWYVKTSYAIDENYYPVAFCTVRTTINENH